jgi:hypothetical protein
MGTMMKKTATKRMTKGAVNTRPRREPVLVVVVEQHRRMREDFLAVFDRSALES